MPNRTGFPPDASDIIAPMPDDHIARLAQIEATRVLTRSVEQMDSTVKKLTAEVASLNTQVAVMQQKDEKVLELKEDYIRLDGKVLALELINAERKGGVSSATQVRDWMPTLIAFIIAVILLVNSKAIHL